MEMPGRPADPSRPFPAALKIQQPESVKIPDRITVGGSGFSRAAAVVVDTGGPGSHAAIVAREYGLPTIMGTVTGTRQLSDGQRVVVDGGAGLVLDQEPLR